MLKRSLLLSLTLVFAIISYAEIEEDQGVYEYVLTSIQTDLEESTSLLSAAMESQSFTIHAIHDMSGGEECDYQAKVFIFSDSNYVSQISQSNAFTGSFAFLDRINLFEDEAGVHASIVNPININRTILMDDEKFLEFSDLHRQKLRALILSALKGEITGKQYGEIRDEGYIGRTMGIMAGGDFDGKIGEIFSAPESEFGPIKQKLDDGLKSPGEDWNIKLVYEAKFTNLKTVVFGMSSQKMEVKSFGIVDEGNDDDREDFACPGLAHAAAYPIEMVMTVSDGKVSIRLLNIMYRMKMYFEDAGMMAFAANMTMPGALEDEIKDMVEKVLGENK